MSLQNRRRVGFFPGTIAVAEEGTQAATGILSSVTDLFKSLLSSFVIGDQVPDYPIKSKQTLQQIITAVSNLFPSPTSVADAQAQLQKAKQYATEAYAKGGDVNVTYGMLYDQVAQTLTNYINAGGLVPASTAPGSTQLGFGGIDPKLLLLAGGAVVVFMLANRKGGRRKKR